MIILHGIINILFWSFLIYSYQKIKKTTQRKSSLFINVTTVLGMVTYGAYITLLVVDFGSSEIWKETLPILILAWAYVYAISVIAGKG